MTELGMEFDQQQDEHHNPDAWRYRHRRDSTGQQREPDALLFNMKTFSSFSV